MKIGGFLRTEWDANAGASFTTFTSGTNAQFTRAGDQLTTRARGVITLGARADDLGHAARLPRWRLELHQQRRADDLAAGHPGSGDNLCVFQVGFDSQRAIVRDQSFTGLPEPNVDLPAVRECVGEIRL